MAKTLKTPKSQSPKGAVEGRGAVMAKLSADDPGLRELRQIQETFSRALFRPLAEGDKLQPEWVDGRTTLEVTDEFMLPNDRLNTVERLEIYSKSYWYRLIDSLYDDYPAVRAAIGDRKFLELITGYLAEYPSASYTARDLGSRFEQFIRDNPALVAPNFDLALDSARFEWAQVVAFDGEAKKPLALDSALGADPSELRLGLQPYLGLLDLNFAIDDYVIALHQRQRKMQGGASNTSLELAVREKVPKVRKPKREKVWVGVHRLENMLYYKRLEPAAFAILKALQEGKSLAEACEEGMALAEPGADFAQELQGWFHLWASMGWLCGR